MSAPAALDRALASLEGAERLPYFDRIRSTATAMRGFLESTSDCDDYPLRFRVASDMHRGLRFAIAGEVDELRSWLQAVGRPE